MISSKLFLGQEDRLRWYFNGPDLFQGTAVESNLTRQKVKDPLHPESVLVVSDSTVAALLAAVKEGRT